MGDYGEYFHEPSKFEEAALVMRESMYELVRDDIKKEMEALRTRNKELEEKFRNLSKLESEANQKIRKAESEIELAKRNALREKYEQISTEFGQIYYVAGYKTTLRPKCGDCDENKKIHAVTDSGKEISTWCDCYNAYDRTWSYEEVVLLKFKVTSEWRYIRWHKDTYGDVEFGDYSRLIYDGKPFEEVEYGRYMFNDERTVKSYVEYLNKKK